MPILSRISPNLGNFKPKRPNFQSICSKFLISPKKTSLSFRPHPLQKKLEYAPMPGGVLQLAGVDKGCHHHLQPAPDSQVHPAAHCVTGKSGPDWWLRRGDPAFWRYSGVSWHHKKNKQSCQTPAQHSWSLARQPPPLLSELYKLDWEGLLAKLGILRL